MIFELVVIILVGTFLLIINKLDEKIWRRFGLAFIAVLIFQYFTQALWLNVNLEPWAYLYLDVAWILTVGWAGIIVVCMKLVDLYCPQLTERARYVLSVLLIGVVGFFAEWAVVALEIRAYPAAVLVNLSGIMLGYGKVPIEALYYIPVFMALMVAFTRYWELLLDHHKVQQTKPKKKRGKKK